MTAIHCTLVDYQSATHSDDLIRLLSHYANHPMGGGEGLSEYTQQNLVQKLDNFPGAFSILLYQNGEARGLANCFMQFSTFRCQPMINIHDFVIHEIARGQGLAHILLNAVEEEARKRACCKLSLEVLEHNAAAQRAYKKFGFAGYELDPEAGKALFWQKHLLNG